MRDQSPTGAGQRPHSPSLPARPGTCQLGLRYRQVAALRHMGSAARNTKSRMWSGEAGRGAGGLGSGSETDRMEGTRTVAGLGIKRYKDDHENEVGEAKAE